MCQHMVKHLLPGPDTRHVDDCKTGPGCTLCFPPPPGDNSSITRDKLELVLEAARWAPTHKLTQPWHFVIIGGSQKDAFEVRGAQPVRIS